MVLHQFFANSFVRLGRAEKHAVRHDTGALTTLSQHPQEQGQKQQLGLFGVGHGFQVVVDAFRVHGALERRICQTHGKLIADLILLGNTVLVVDLRVADGVQHQVHRRNAQHGAVCVKAGEGIPSKVLPLLGSHGILVVVANVLRGGDQKACRAAGRVADGVIRGGLQQLHHHFPDVLGSAKLAVLPSGGQFAQHVLVQVALHIQIGNVMLIQVIQPCDDFLQHLRRRNQEHRIAHVPGKGRLILHITAGIVGDFHQFPLLGEVRQAAMFHVFDGREDPLGNYIENIAGIVVLEFTPAHGLSNGRLGENLLHLLASHMLKFFRFQLFFVQRADKHKIGQLFDDG